MAMTPFSGSSTSPVPVRTSVTDLRRREQAISALSGMRNYHSLVSGSPDSDVLDVTVTPVVDASSEGPETVILQLGPGNGYLVGSASSATVVIGDDDTALPKVGITATKNSTMEITAVPAVFTISRTGSTDLPLTVNYDVSGTATSGSDFTALSGSVTILAGNASATVEITPVDDSASESLETVIATLSRVV